MSDFFTRLIERTLGLAQVAQPRIPSMFDQVSTISSDNQQSLAQDDEPLNTKDSVSVTPVLKDHSAFSESIHPPSVPQNKSSSATSSQYSPRTNDIGSAPPRQVVSGSLEQEKTVYSQMIIGQNDLRKYALNPANSKDLINSKRSKESFFSRNDPSSDKIVLDHDQNNGLPPASSPDENRDTSEVLIDSDKVSMLRDVPKANSDRNTGLPPANSLDENLDAYRVLNDSNQVSVLRDMLESLEEQSAKTSNQNLDVSSQICFKHENESKSPSSTPNIRVTIGRVEVRVTPSVTSAPRTRSPSPILSLDDYLKQRNEGQR